MSPWCWDFTCPPSRGTNPGLILHLRHGGWNDSLVDTYCHLIKKWAFGCRWNCISHSYSDYFPDNLGAVSHEHEERFRQDMIRMGEYDQGLWNLAMLFDYACFWRETAILPTTDSLQLASIFRSFKGSWFLSNKGLSI